LKVNGIELFFFFFFFFLGWNFCIVNQKKNLDNLENFHIFSVIFF
jgi:hypothetical protein